LIQRGSGSFQCRLRGMRFAFGIFAVSVLDLGCGSDSAPLKAPPPDAARAFDASGAPADGSVDGTAGCWQPDFPLPAPVACSGTVRDCDTGLDSCLSTRAGRALTRLAQECGMYCGELEVAFVAGCAAEWRDIIPSNNVEPCLPNAMLGQRWTCTPENGWVRVYIGSCTLASVLRHDHRKAL